MQASKKPLMQYLCQQIGAFKTIEMRSFLKKNNLSVNRVMGETLAVTSLWLTTRVKRVTYIALPNLILIRDDVLKLVRVFSYLLAPFIYI